MSAADGVGGGVEVAGIVLARIRDHGPWTIDRVEGVFCAWCYTRPSDYPDLPSDGVPHDSGCLWLEVVAATDRTSQGGNP